MIKKYCYREVEFYKEAYIGMFFLKDDGDKRLLFVLDLIYQNKKILINKLKKFKKWINEDKTSEFEVYAAGVIKIKFNRTSPLKKEFWKTDAEMVLDSTYRMKQYIKMFKDGEKFYEIMVMPAFYDAKKKEWLMTNWLPVIKNISDEELGKIAVMSNTTQVDDSAKNMGLYTIEWVKGLYVETWELVDNGGINSSTKTEFDC
jgi:hypothetical protein